MVYKMYTNVSSESRPGHPEVYEDTLPHTLVFYILMGVIGLFGNILTSIVIIRNKEMRTAINFCLLNLAISSLIFLFICFPPIFLLIKTLRTDFHCQLRYVVSFDFWNKHELLYNYIYYI